MRTPFVRNHDTGLWIATAMTATLAVGAGIWFYWRRRNLAVDQAGLDHQQDYLKGKFPQKKKRKTDIHELAELINH